MTRAPSAILVVRHGARLDAVDRDWHFTSPAPYDPPLTYGGWNQAKALGSRIANIISKRAAESSKKAAGSHQNGNGNGAKPAPRKQKVVIHSSPFLRCLQTSVALGAGMAQSLEISGKRRKKSEAGKGKHEEVYDSQQYSVKALGLATPEQITIKTILRVDAFLGEWLTPDYFEHMTPPPDSTLMVAAGKAHLLRNEQIEVFQPSTQGHGHFPGGWSRSNASRQTPVAETAVIVDDNLSIDSMSLMAPLRQQRSNSAVSFGDKSGHIHILSSLRPSKAAYDPPIPAYAIAPSDPIPRGYCVHARDECTDIDLLWDSMRLPQDWGDGGELGEEWSGMHKRFRRGLSKMVEWYQEHTPEFHPDREDPLALDHHDDIEEDDDDYDLTVVMVTHAAGCNALVGALTDQPVLLDFGLTSLSMAVRKEHHELAGKGRASTNGPPPVRRHSSFHLSLADDYEMKIVSSTEHLRAGAQATKASALASPHLVAQIPTYSSLSHETPHEPKRAMSSALGSIRRSSITPTAPLHADSISPRSVSSGGLWSRTSTFSSSTDEVPSISIGAPAQTCPTISNQTEPFDTAHHEQGADHAEDAVPPLPEAKPAKSANQRGGLWGAGWLPVAKRYTGPAPKRRWTVTQQDEFD